ncbi:uncharacterized protein LOC133800048 [Humulus lupulus]|uniref:uncharacterized protein LOC133800048 n=1 Tax=Humulus lupulus TaxID=3486 RepID=UPI002B409E0A|nr:uncharacterized protein LOC133800048 [Humulus lupulus]
MSTKIKKGVSMREHVLSMINVMHEEKIHGVVIDERTQASITLESLTPAFSAFTTIYIMNKLEFNMTQLLNKLQTFVSLNKTKTKETEANVAREKPSTSKDKTKKRKKNNDKDKSKDKKSNEGCGGRRYILESSRELADGEVTMRVGSGALVSARAKG